MSKFVVLDDDDFQRVTVVMKHRKYEVIADLLRMGLRGIFIEDINRKNAWYIAKRLSKILGRDIGYFKSQLETGAVGYVFYIKPSNEEESCI